MAAKVNMAAATVPIEVDFGGLPRERLEHMVAAGEEVVECHRALAKTDDNIVGELLRGTEGFYEWDHYPSGDVYDHESHAQFYYHAHPQELRGGEHGHFHTFMRPLGMPEGIRPVALPDYEEPKEPNDALSHLIAISMDKFGVPIRLFSTNRWVTGEVWYKAEDVAAMLDRYIIDHTQPSWPVNRWVSAMMRFFHPQIVALLKARDESVAAWAAKHGDRNVYEDRELEITSVADISVDDQMRLATEALEAKPRF